MVIDISIIWGGGGWLLIYQLFGGEGGWLLIYQLFGGRGVVIDISIFGAFEPKPLLRKISCK